jgi:Dyp-type peroxidase family
MDAGPVSATVNPSPSWKLAAPAAAATQGLVVSGFGNLETGRALFLELGEGTRGGGWLSALRAVAPITAAIPPDKEDAAAQTRAAAIAFSWTGLARMGLDADALASFSRPFREGMFQEDRLRRLGDRRGDGWLSTVIKEGPQWSANTPLREAAPDGVEADLVADGGYVEAHLATPVTVHALLLLYTDTEEAAKAWAAAVEQDLALHDVRIVHRLPLILDVEGAGISREHFGFADGLSQPAPYDDGGAVTLAGRPAPHDPVQGVPLGEFLIGYTNGHHEKAPGPFAPDAARAAAAGLPPHPQAEGFFDLGLNGSYMVVRELKQDVAAFWNAMDANTARMREQDPDHSGHVTAEWLAERVIGRDREGHLLCPGNKLAPGPDGLPRNDFLFHARDPQGVGCPPGSHVRRANPRDALAPTDSARETLLQAANNHRILRRGRKYGSKIADYRVPDDADRGLLFVCLNTDIARQFEFVQQTWLLNSNFATLFDETDPLVGPPGRMTIREEPLRRTVHVDTFVQMVGGDYFFLPSLPALNYLAAL